MNKPQPARLDDLQARVGYRFRDPALLIRALTHISLAASESSRAGSYQRLEFLGDRVLGLAVSAMLYAEFPDADEGEMSRRLAALVRRETCAEVAVEWGVGPAIRLGDSEAAAGGQNKSAILSDVCESIIGGVFVDAGFAAAEHVVRAAWTPRMREPTRPLRDPKTALQEWAQSLGKPAPIYHETARTGPHHAPKFTVGVAIDGYGAAAGTGTSKRTAEQAAAEAFLTLNNLSSVTEKGGFMTETEAQRCGFVALIGAPNAGKSTLLNALVGTKVSIVSRKVQTTRTLVRGIAIQNGAQIIFVDTPGIFAPKRRLDRAMVTAAWSGAGDADVVALLIDARKGLNEEAESILARLAEAKTPRLLILNKIDTVEPPSLLELTKTINDRLPFDQTFMISALRKHGLPRLLEAFAALMPSGPWLYPEDQVTDAPLRAFAAEVTREKMFERLHDELPYQTTVETEQWKELPDGSVRIEQTIFVTRDGHKKIVLGEGGKTIKSIGKAARLDIAEAAETPVHLFLFVKVRENWIDDPERYREMGLEFPKDS